MELHIQIPFNEIDAIIADIGSMENIEVAILKEKNTVPVSVLDRGSNNQFEIWDTIITIILTQATKEMFELSKNRITEYLKKRKIKIKKINRAAHKNKKR